MTPVSISDKTGKTIVPGVGSIVTTAVTANQVIAAIIAGSGARTGETFYLEQWDVEVFLTALAATQTDFGSVSLRIGGVPMWTVEALGNGVVWYGPFDPGEPIPVLPGVTVDLVCTPKAATSFTWFGNILGHSRAQ